jgi:hypothetical protein
VEQELGRDADRFPILAPLSPESLHFRYDYPHPKADPPSVYTFDFIVYGDGMPYGVVVVVYYDLTVQLLD